MKRFSFLAFIVCLVLIFSVDIQAQNAEQRAKIIRESNTVELSRLVKMFKAKAESDFTAAKAKAEEMGWPIRQTFENGTIIQLKMLDDKGKPVYYITDNLNAQISLSTDDAKPGGSTGFDLTGLGIEIGEWDGGDARPTHEQYNGRVTLMDAVGNSDHSTHVCGTMIGDGSGNSSAQGMADSATVLSYDFNGDDPEMSAEALAGMILSNHSYGLISGWYYNGVDWYWYGDTTLSGTEDEGFGQYSSAAVGWDGIANASPYYLIVKSAGNDRGDEPSTNPTNHFVWNGVSAWVSSSTFRPADGGTLGYDCISANGNAKNILTVGAVSDVTGGYSTPAGVVMSSFSGWGPTDDGRIKPDIVGNGVGLTSSGSLNDTDYYSSNGTSMSAPNVTGSIALLQEHYSNTHSGDFMRSATVKALVIHTADECGTFDGPDYQFGWGLMNTAEAAEQIAQDTIDPDRINELTLLNTGSYTLNVTSDGTPLEVTIAWNDPVGTAKTGLNDTTRVLVNDLDVEVTEGANTYSPWILDGANPANAATKGDNIRDNVEKVYIASPTNGATYTITVDHKGTLSASQDYSIIISGVTSATCVRPTTADTSNNTSNSVDIDWSSINVGGDYIIEYGVEGFTKGTGTFLTGSVSTAGMSVTVSGLSKCDVYDFYLTEVCTGADTSNAFGPGKINIAPTTICAPFCEDFENGGSIPTGWTNTSSTSKLWQFSTTTASSGWGATADHTTGSGYMAWVDDSDFLGDQGTDVTLTSPLIDLTGLSNPKIKWWYHSNNTTTSTYATLSLDFFDGTTWNNNAWTFTGSNAGWEEDSLDLSTYTISGDVQFRFVNDNDNFDFHNDISVDDICVTGSSCTPPATPGSITGNTWQCPNQSSTYSVGSVTGATSYLWTLPSGWTGSSTTNSITITAGTSGGDVSVQSINSCDTSAASSLTVSVPSIDDGVACTKDTCIQATTIIQHTPDNSLCDDGDPCNGVETCNVSLGCQSGTPPSAPATPGAISGNTWQCPNRTTTYSISPVSGATHYVWTLPSGWTGSSSDTLITVTVNTNGGTISVAAADACDTSANSNLSVTVPSIDDGVACTKDSCIQATTTITHVPDNSLCDDGDPCNGVETCNVSTGCQAGTPPAGIGTPGAISGIDTVCANVGFTYEINSVSGATHYVWTLPTGWTGTSSDTAITVTNNGTGGTLSVAAASSCDTSGTSSFAIDIRDVNDGVSCTQDSCDIVTGNAINTPDNTACDDGDPCNGVETCSATLGCLAGTPASPPATPGAISGNTWQCPNRTTTYTISAVSGATHYVWTLPSGWTGSSSDTTINVTVNTNGGTISVAAANACDTSATSDLSVTVPTVSDGITCTKDSCIQATMTITHTPDNSLCDDGDPCNGAETCNPVSGCTAGTPPAAPTASFTHTSTGLTANFTDASTGATSWDWDFGDANTSTMQNPSHTYASADTYTVCLIVYDGCAYDTICDSNVIITAPIGSGFTWVGGTSTDFSLGANWSGGVAPSSCSDDITIPDVSGASGNFPMLSSGTIIVGDLTIDANASMTVMAGAILSVCGDLLNNGTDLKGKGSMEIKGSPIKQNVTGDVQVAHFILDNPNGADHLSGTIEVDSSILLQNGTWTTNGNPMILTSNAPNISGQVDPSGTGSIVGDLTVQRFIPDTYTGNVDTGAYENGYHYVSSPVDDATIADFGDNWSWSTPGGYPAFNLEDYITGTYFDFGTFYEYNEAAADPGSPFGAPYHYERWEAPSTTNAVPGRGYAAHMQQNATIELSGTYTHSSSPTIGLTKTGSTLFDGWNLIGNPFPSGYDWTSAIRTNVDAAIYWWDPVNLQYISSVPGTGTSPLINNLGAVQSSASPNGTVILPMQGVMVVANNTGASVNFDNTGRTLNGGAFYRSSQGGNPVFSLLMTTDKGYKDETAIYLEDNATSNYDGEYDAYKFKSPNTYVPTIYSISNDSRDLSINGIGKVLDDAIIPLGVSAKHSGMYSIELNQKFDLNPGQVIYLEDRDKNIFTDLNNASAYSFQFDKGDTEEGRFFIHIYPQLEISFDKADCDGLNGAMYLDQKGSLIWDDILVYDSEGNLIKTLNNFNGNDKLDDLAPGNYSFQIKKGGYEAVIDFELEGNQTVFAEFEADQSIRNVGEYFQFTNNSLNATFHDWKMGDGTQISNLDNVTYTYVTPGTYDVTLYSANEDCDDEIIKTVEVTSSKSTSVEDVIDESLQINIHNNLLTITSTEEMTSIEIFNSIGKQILTTDNEVGKEFKTILEDRSAAYYIVKVNINDEITAKKVLVTK